jgi:DNA repair exonuclease SbcCD ATPase subunit
MRLRSITVRNYRLHRELHMELDAARTVIGGPNEAGKSTLVEATHRALFLKAKGAGEIHKSMRSHFHAGHPEVEVAFEAAGREYRILKRFSGATGTATLTEAGGPTWKNEQAETKLGQLLGVDGHASGKEATQQWAHLWVWQGDAGGDPTEHANRQRDTLLARLQGGDAAGAAMQSELDARVAGRFAAMHEGIFNKNGSPRTASAVAQAEDEASRAREKRAQAQAASARLEAAMRDFEEAECVIETSRQTLEHLAAQQAEIEARSTRVAELRQAETRQAQELAAAAEKLHALQEADRQIGVRRAETQKLTGELAPRETETQRLAEAEAAARRRQTETEAEARQATDRERASRLRHELAGAYVALFQRTAQRDQLTSQRARVQQLRRELGEVESALAAVPVIVPAQLDTLRELERARDKAEATLAAMAAGIEILASDVPVTIAGTALEPGQPHVLTEDTEVALGSRIRLRITPGGGTSLAKARTELRAAHEALQRQLDTLGVFSTASAAAACAQRQQLAGKVREFQARLEGARAGSIEQEFAEAEQARATTEAEIQRRSPTAGNFRAPPDPIAAAIELASAEPELREAEAQMRGAEKARDEAGRQWRDAEQKLSTQRRATQEQRDAVSRLEAELRLLVETHGVDAARGERLETMRLTQASAEAQLATTRHALAELQPDLLAQERAAHARSLAATLEARNLAEQTRAVARNTLRSDGTDDPQETLALAEAGERAAGARLELARRHAAAIARLHTLFIEEQRALAEQVTRPLAEKVSGYLQCLFGAGANARIGIEDKAFGALTLVRSGDFFGSFPFDALSGGAREQVAAAVRLGMAEVLAAAHDGCLPVVFDDAFAYSDPARVQTLQRMLDLAAHRGLQIIVLTCNPADYATLGAKQVALRTERPTEIASAAKSPDLAADLSQE